MRWVWAMAGVIWAGAAVAEGAMTGAEIQAALTGRVLDYGTATQDFRASGRTLYDAGEPSWGYWRVEGDRYCSQWPPRAEWSCYGVEVSEEGVRFIGPSGDVTEGRYVD